MSDRAIHAEAIGLKSKPSLWATSNIVHLISVAICASAAWNQEWAFFSLLSERQSLLLRFINSIIEALPLVWLLASLGLVFHKKWAWFICVGFTMLSLLLTMLLFVAVIFASDLIGLVVGFFLLLLPAGVLTLLLMTRRYSYAAKLQ